MDPGIDCEDELPAPADMPAVGNQDMDIVGLRTLLLREMVFTLCLKLFLDYFFLRNPMVPTTF